MLAGEWIVRSGKHVFFYIMYISYHIYLSICLSIYLSTSIDFQQSIHIYH